MRKCCHTSWLCTAHAREQQAGLLIEQLQHLAFELVITQRHAEKVRAIDRLRVRRKRGGGNFVHRQGWKIEHLCHPGTLPVPLSNYSATLTNGRPNPGEWMAARV
jgi:hypothetical protein